MRHLDEPDVEVANPLDYCEVTPLNALSADVPPISTASLAVPAALSANILA